MLLAGNVGKNSLGLYNLRHCHTYMSLATHHISYPFVSSCSGGPGSTIHKFLSSIEMEKQFLCVCVVGIIYTLSPINTMEVNVTAKDTAKVLT